MVLVLTTLAACSLGKGKPLESGDITKENISQVCEILNEAGLSNVDVFEKWVKESASGASEKASEVSGFNDADCRMTVPGDRITHQKRETLRQLYIRMGRE